jgi:hypothetical protein
MDPDDFPTTITMSALNDAKDAEEFEKLLLDSLSDDPPDLPLDRFCTNGGWGDEPEFHEVDVTDFSTDSVNGTIELTFTESYHSGCRDIDWTEGHSAAFDFVFSRETGELELTGGIPKRDYEPDEF